MKKLMVVAMVAMAAIAANAAKVQWGVNGGTIEQISSGTMFLVWADSAPSFAGLAEMENFTESTISSIGGKIVGDSVAYGGGVQTQFTIVKPNNPVAGMAAGSHKFYTMIISSDGKEFAYSPVASGTILNNETTLNIAKPAGNFTVVEAAPEPTSGLLLLLGVAGLALRRRRA